MTWRAICARPCTLEKFETEWYELEAQGKLNKEDLGIVPDVYLYNQAGGCHRAPGTGHRAPGTGHRAPGARLNR